MLSDCILPDRALAPSTSRDRLVLEYNAVAVGPHGAPHQALVCLARTLRKVSLHVSILRPHPSRKLYKFAPHTKPACLLCSCSSQQQAFGRVQHGIEHEVPGRGCVGQISRPRNSRTLGNHSGSDGVANKKTHCLRGGGAWPYSRIIPLS